VQRLFEQLNTWSPSDTDPELDAKLEAIDEDPRKARNIWEHASSWTPRVVFLADRVVAIPEDARERLGYHGALLIGRDDVTSREIPWPAMAIQRLVNRWRAWNTFHQLRLNAAKGNGKSPKKMSAAERSEDIRKLKEWSRAEPYEAHLIEELYKALLAVLLFVPSRAHIYHKSRPTITEWLSYDPGEACAVLNSTFEKSIGAKDLRNSRQKKAGEPVIPGWLRGLWKDGRISARTWQGI
jgi:hypothetical protein